MEQLDALNNRTCIYYGTAYGTTANCSGVSPAPAEGETVVVDPRGNKTTYSFDTTFRTTDIKDHNGGVVHYDFDSNNNKTCVTDQRGKKTGYSYDTKGNVTQMIDALNTDASCALKAGGVKWTYTYTTNNDIDLETDPLSRQTDYIYDTAGNLTRVARKDSGGAVKALNCFERDSSAQVTGSVQSTNLTVPAGPTDPCTGNKTLFGYDTYGNQTCVVNARFSGTITCVSDPGKKATFIYDLGGRLLYSTNEITNNARPARGSAPETGGQCGTDGNGNGINDDPSDDSVVDDGCPSTKYAYDAQNNILTVTDGLGNISSDAYNPKGSKISTRTRTGRQLGQPPRAARSVVPRGPATA